MQKPRKNEKSLGIDNEKYSQNTDENSNSSSGSKSSGTNIKVVPTITKTFVTISHKYSSHQ